MSDTIAISISVSHARLIAVALADAENIDLINLRTMLETTLALDDAARTGFTDAVQQGELP